MEINEEIGIIRVKLESTKNKVRLRKNQLYQPIE